MKTPIPLPKHKASPPETDVVSTGPAREAMPHPPGARGPREKKKDPKALTLVVTLLALAMLLFVPALVLLTRLQS